MNKIYSLLALVAVASLSACHTHRPPEPPYHNNWVQPVAPARPQVRPALPRHQVKPTPPPRPKAKPTPRKAQPGAHDRGRHQAKPNPRKGTAHNNGKRNNTPPHQPPHR